MKSPFSPAKSRKETYKEKYDATKRGGESFFPETLARDALVALLIIGVIAALAILFPAHVEPPADPTSTTYNPRPEWYFLFFFQFLKLFPGRLEPVAAVVVPTIALLTLALIPFLDRGLERNWSKRGKVLAMGGVFILVFAALEVMGTLSAPARPAGEESKIVQSGRNVYQEINCSYCHSINGVGGSIGPDLSAIGRDLNEEQLRNYLLNPHAMVPSTLHPKLYFTEEEMDGLLAYLKTLGEEVSFSAEAPQLYKENCSSCHMINGEGGRLGPDLSAIGSRRSLNFLEAFTAAPGSVLPGTSMPAYKDKLSPEQIRDIAAYLYSHKSETAPSETPPPPSASIPPVIPHDLTGRDNCLLCHETGVGGAPEIPADHAGRANDTCTVCHAQR